MARTPSGFYSTIEYIGPRPQKPKRRNFFGGWVIIVIAVAIGCWFARPLVPFLRAAQVNGSAEKAQLVIASLERSHNFGDGLAASALNLSMSKEANTSGSAAAADAIVRSYKGVNVDLPELLFQDMTENSRPYPDLWGSKAANREVDSTRVPNLQCFFKRKGETIKVTRNYADYLPGDVVVWSLGNAEPHIGIVVPCPDGGTGTPWVVHNPGGQVKWEDCLFEYTVQGHFRFPAQAGQ